MTCTPSGALSSETKRIWVAPARLMTSTAATAELPGREHRIDGDHQPVLEYPPAAW